ncbi:MAG: response regulator transcription factor [Chitinophagaceae bacterium]|nr:response regulator transcription factor [Chitinophagaceae bacterium]
MMMAPQSEKFNLTEREKEILQRLIESRSLRSIAESLFISLETVRTHVKHIYKKLHVANRTEAVMKAIQQGLV